MAAAERGIWKSSELRRMLADAGLEISVGKVSKLWTTTPTTLRLDDLDVICAVLDCTPGDLLTADLAAAAARKPQAEIEEQASNGSPSIVRPRFNGNRPEPPL